jgi:hypothetical protein
MTGWDQCRTSRPVACTRTPMTRKPGPRRGATSSSATPQPAAWASGIRRVASWYLVRRPVIQDDSWAPVCSGMPCGRDGRQASTLRVDMLTRFSRRSSA